MENDIISRLKFTPTMALCPCGSYHKVKYSEDKEIGWIKCFKRKLDNIVVYKNGKIFNPE